MRNATTFYESLLPCQSTLSESLWVHRYFILINMYTTKMIYVIILWNLRNQDDKVKVVHSTVCYENQYKSPNPIWDKITNCDLRFLSLYDPYYLKHDSSHARIEEPHTVSHYSVYVAFKFTSFRLYLTLFFFHYYRDFSAQCFRDTVKSRPYVSGLY